MTKTSKMTHDEIVLSLTPSKIKEIITPYFGEKGVWSPEVWQLLRRQSSLVFSRLIDNRDLLISIDGYAYTKELHTFAELTDSLRTDWDSVNGFGVQEAINIEYAFEHPLIKGTGQYAITKGYLDLVVLAKPTSIGPFSAYKDDTRQFVVEVKTSKEMSDMGSVLRQIKEYREYYGRSTDIFQTTSMRLDSHFWDHLVWLLVTPTVTDEVKNFFAASGIYVHSLESEQTNLIEPEVIQNEHSRT